MNMCKDPELHARRRRRIAKALREPLLKVFPAGAAGPAGRHPVLPAQRRDDRPASSGCSSAASRSGSLENHKIPFTYDDEVVKLIASRCTELESGGRMIDAILTNTVLPRISEEFLKRMMEGTPAGRVRVRVAEGEFAYAFE